MRDSATGSSGDVPTVLVRDSEGKDLLCFLEQLIPLDGQDYSPDDRREIHLIWR